MNVLVCGCATRGCLCVCPMCAPVCGAFERLCILHVYVGVRCNCVLRAAGGRGSFGSASGGAVKTQLIVRKEAGERQGGEATGLINKSSVLSLRTQPAEGTEELWLSARNSGRHPMPHAEESWGSAAESFRAAAAAWRRPVEGVKCVCDLQFYIFLLGGLMDI